MPPDNYESQTRRKINQRHSACLSEMHDGERGHRQCKRGGDGRNRNVFGNLKCKQPHKHDDKRRQGHQTEKCARGSSHTLASLEPEPDRISVANYAQDSGDNAGHLALDISRLSTINDPDRQRDRGRALEKVEHEDDVPVRLSHNAKNIRRADIAAPCSSNINAGQARDEITKWH